MGTKGMFIFGNFKVEFESQGYSEIVWLVDWDWIKMKQEKGVRKVYFLEFLYSSMV